MSIHNSFVCSPHTAICGHQEDDPLWDEFICNPYYKEGYCPTNGRGPGCTTIKDVSDADIRVTLRQWAWKIDNEFRTILNLDERQRRFCLRELAKALRELITG